MASKNKKYMFTLSNINIDNIEQKYGLGVNKLKIDLENNTAIVIPKNTTKIDDLDKKKKEIISFLDESKRIHRCTISMIDFTTKENINNFKKYKCFWDKNFFPSNIQPIGCPIKYISNKATKKYYSEISKETYSITEPISSDKTLFLEEKKDGRISIEYNDYYQTDGIFCSFNCCLAYIQSAENKKNPMYKFSESLLLKLFSEINEEKNEKEDEIMPAPHWRTLNDFGGNLTIEQFRESFNKIKYSSHGIYFLSLGMLFEDEIKF